MQNLKKSTDKYMKNAMISYGVLAAIVLICALGLPANKLAMHAYGLPDSTYRVITFLLNLPAAIIVITGFYAYAKLFQYSDSIDNGEEKLLFRQIAIGVKWLAWSLPVWLIVISVCRELINWHTSLLPEYRMIITYSSIFLPLVGFSIIGHAVHFRLDKFKLSYKPKNAMGAIATFIIGATLFCLGLFNQIDFTNFASNHNMYNVPFWVIILTIIFPLLYTWLVGLLASDKINNLSKNVNGVLYRRYLKLVSYGLMMVIGSLIVFQLASTLVFNPGYFKLDAGLVLLEFLAIIRCAGFVMIALGAVRLKRIEEI